MRKLYLARLSPQEKVELQSLVKKLQGKRQKIRRAQILLKANADGPCSTDERAEQSTYTRFQCSSATRLELCQNPFHDFAVNVG